MNFTRQKDLIDMETLAKNGISVIGVGAIGSFTATTLAKMGASSITIFDEDGVSTENLPNQFYRKQDIGRFKVDALTDIIRDLSETLVTTSLRPYENQKLEQTVIVATDSMRSRRRVWEEFQKQDQSLNLIEARMGAELGMIYTIRKKEGVLSSSDFAFYEEMLYSDEKVKPLPCTARTIIYNVLMIASLISRSYKAIIQNEEFPRELVFNMTSINKLSWMVRS